MHFLRNYKYFIILLFAVFMLIPISTQAAVKPSTPVNLRIPQISVNATIESRNVTRQGLMQPPSTAKRVGWDRGAGVPGNPGEAVLYGHLTDNAFRPAVFSRLNYLSIGSRMVVTDAKGGKHTFKVMRKKAIRADRITYFDVSRDTKYIHLNLYTCAGRWDAKLHRYTHFLVVYTTLVSSTPK